jgi:hypothetical protein
MSKYQSSHVGVAAALSILTFDVLDHSLLYYLLFCLKVAEKAIIFAHEEILSPKLPL